MSTSVVTPVPAATLDAAQPAPGALLHAISEDPGSLVYFLLNVGDGDAQLLLLPPDSNDRIRRLVVVDVATPNKLPALIESLHDAGLIQPPGSPGQIRLLVATHPHFDHIGGMADLLDRFNGPNGCIEQVWDPGYFLPTPAFHTLMSQLEASPWIRRLQPTSGTSMFLDKVQLTVIGPGIGLRNRFDTYGVGINDSSITLMVSFPAASIYAERDPRQNRVNRRASGSKPRRLLLGGDAQFTSWAQATIDFPALVQEQNPALAKELRAAIGPDYLNADVFKISHHASKHGVTLELLERVNASLALVSSVAGGGKYGFPHLLAMEAIREAREPTAAHAVVHQPDQHLGIHLTGAKLDSGETCGSIVLLIPERTGKTLRMFRLMDQAGKRIDLAKSREVRL